MEEICESRDDFLTDGNDGASIRIMMGECKECKEKGSGSIDAIRKSHRGRYAHRARDGGCAQHWLSLHLIGPACSTNLFSSYII